jgi:hypothetical protein
VWWCTAGGARRVVAGGVHRERAAPVPASRHEGGTGGQARAGAQAPRRRRGQHRAHRRGPHRPLPGPGPAPGGPALVPQARPHPGPALRTVRRPRHRRPGLPGHHGRPHAASRQQRPHPRRGHPHRRHDLRPRQRRHRRRLPHQPPPRPRPLASRRPATTPNPHHRRRRIGATGKHWRSSNFNRNVLQRAYQAAGWRDPAGGGTWTWHSLCHAFCTTALFTWKLDPTDVSRMAGHSSYRITLDMYVNSHRRHPRPRPPSHPIKDHRGRPRYGGLSRRASTSPLGSCEPGELVVRSPGSDAAQTRRWPDSASSSLGSDDGHGR